MADPFANVGSSIDSPAVDGAAVTPSDTVDLATPTRALYVGGTGDVKVDMVGGSTLTFAAVQAGTLLAIRVRRVYATGTTAGSIVGVW